MLREHRDRPKISQCGARELKRQPIGLTQEDYRVLVTFALVQLSRWTDTVNELEEFARGQQFVAAKAVCPVLSQRGENLFGDLVIWILEIGGEHDVFNDDGLEHSNRFQMGDSESDPIHGVFK